MERICLGFLVTRRSPALVDARHRCKLLRCCREISQDLKRESNGLLPIPHFTTGRGTLEPFVEFQATSGMAGIRMEEGLQESRIRSDLCDTRLLQRIVRGNLCGGLCHVALANVYSEAHMRPSHQTHHESKCNKCSTSPLPEATSAACIPEP